MDQLLTYAPGLQCFTRMELGDFLTQDFVPDQIIRLINDLAESTDGPAQLSFTSEAPQDARILKGIVSTGLFGLCTVVSKLDGLCADLAMSDQQNRNPEVLLRIRTMRMYREVLLGLIKCEITDSHRIIEELKPGEMALLCNGYQVVATRGPVNSDDHLIIVAAQA